MKKKKQAVISKKVILLTLFAAGALVLFWVLFTNNILTGSKAAGNQCDMLRKICLSGCGGNGMQPSRECKSVCQLNYNKCMVKGGLGSTIPTTGASSSASTNPTQSVTPVQGGNDDWSKDREECLANCQKEKEECKRNAQEVRNKHNQDCETEATNWLTSCKDSCETNYGDEANDRLSECKTRCENEKKNWLSACKKLGADGYATLARQCDQQGAACKEGCN